MKKIKVNENWEFEEVEDLSDLFVVLLKHGSFDQGYIEAFDTDDILMKTVYDGLANQYDDCGCDELTKIYLIKVPNTEQTVSLCNTGLFNGNCCDPHVIEAVRDLFNRADCERLECWSGAGLTEAKKKKKPYSSAYCGLTDPVLNIKHFNKCMGTGGLQTPNAKPLIVGDVLPDGPAASAEASSDTGTGLSESLETDIRELLNGADAKKPFLFEVNATEQNDPSWCVEKFEDGEEIDFSHLKIYDRTPEEKENGEYIATFMLSGGKNGNGDWIEYLGELLGAFKAIKGKTGADPLLYKLDTDIIDDVWTARVFLYDHADAVQESLKEDLIVIEPEEAKAKMFELRDQIKAEKDKKVRKNLLVLMNVYLFQTFFGGMPHNNNEAEKAKAAGEDEMVHSDLTKGEWEELSKFHKEETEKLESTLTEASLDYATQLMKMQAFENGTRGFNVKAASDEKLLYNYRICLDNDLNNALSVIEAELKYRGINIPKRLVMLNRVELTPKDINAAYAEFILQNKDHSRAITRKYDNITELIICLLIALRMKDAKLSTEIKDYILSRYETSLDALKDCLRKFFSDNALVAALTAAVAKTGFFAKRMNEQLAEFKAGEFEPIALESHVRDWMAAQHPYEYQLDEITKELTWQEVIDAIANGEMDKLLTGLDSAPREEIWKKACELHYAQTGEAIGEKEDIEKYIEKALSDDEGETKMEESMKTLYIYDGPVYSGGHKVIDSWQDKTMAVSQDKAMNNLKYKLKQAFGFPGIELVPECLTAQDVEDDEWPLSLLDRKPTKCEKCGALLMDNGECPVCDHGDESALEEATKLEEAKRYVKRYYIRPQNIFCSNKEEILKALVEIDDENCSVYSLKSLPDHDDVHLLKPSDIIYYYDDGILYDKNHVKVMDYDLFVKNEETRKKFGNVDAVSDATFEDEYADRLTDADLKDKEIKVRKPTHEDIDDAATFELDFDDIDVYGDKVANLREGKENTYTCCICGEECTGYGNNPEPVKHEGRCCDACNLKFVIPARMLALEANDKDEE